MAPENPRYLVARRLQEVLSLKDRVAVSVDCKLEEDSLENIKAALHLAVDQLVLKY